VIEPLRAQIADAFRQEESMRETSAGLRDEVVGAVMDRSARAPGTPRLLVLVTVLLAGAVIATLVGLRHLTSQSTPAAPPTPDTIVSTTSNPSVVATPPPVQFTTAHLASAVGQLRGQIVVVLTETGLTPGQTVSYHITGQIDLVYDCGSGGPGGPSHPIRGPVDFTATRTADAQGTVSASIAIPPPVGAPGCTPPTRSPVVTGNWLNFVVEDTTAGVSKSAGGLDVAT